MEHKRKLEKKSSSASLIFAITDLPFGSIDRRSKENKDFGLCNMQVPLECFVPCEKSIFPPHSEAHGTSSSFKEKFS